MMDALCLSNAYHKQEKSYVRSVASRKATDRKEGAMAFTHLSADEAVGGKGDWLWGKARQMVDQSNASLSALYLSLTRICQRPGG